MEEPSVLDFLKSKLMPWKYPAIRLPASETQDIPDIGKQAARSIDLEQENTLEDSTLNQLEVSESFDERVESPKSSNYPPASFHETKQKSELKALPIIHWPWFSFAALILAILGQASLSPGSNRSWTPGIYLILIGMIFAGIAAWRHEWQIHPLPNEKEQFQPASFRPRDLTIGIILAVVAFFSFSRLLFSVFNLAILLVALFFIFRAFGSPIGWTQTWERIRASFTRPLSIQIHPNELLSTLAKSSLVIATIGLVTYFRFYDLAQTPAEMNSDHAEKILDIWNVLLGYTQIFFPSNGGREALHIYLAAGLHKYFHIPLGFDLLKISTVLVGYLSLPFIYLLGKELGNARTGWFAFLFAGIAYWPNVVSRVGLRLPFYILFTAATLYFLLRGFRRGSRNDFIWAGISLGLSLYGYSADRILPILVLVAFGLYWLHPHAKNKRASLTLSLLVLILFSFILFLPLLNYIIEQPDSFLFRTLTRMGNLERPIDQSPLKIFLDNYARAFGMFSWSAGVIWPASIPNYPALGVVSGALFYLGVALVIVRYFREHNWRDLFILLSIPVLFLPSVLAIAFPSENPSLYRTGGASIPVFLLIGMALDGLIMSIRQGIQTPWSKWFAWGLAILLFSAFAIQEHDWVFNQYSQQYKISAWNSSEMAQVAKDFMEITNSEDTVWVMGVAHWVDTRLVAIQAGFPTRDFALFANQVPDTSDDPRAKLFMVRPDDQTSIDALTQSYPAGWFQRYRSYAESKDFLIFIVPAKKTP